MTFDIFLADPDGRRQLVVAQTIRNGAVIGVPTFRAA